MPNLNKYGNPEPAKALSWVVDKTMQDFFFSNEIDAAEEANLTVHLSNQSYQVKTTIWKNHFIYIPIHYVFIL